MTWTALTVDWSREAVKNLRGLAKKDQGQIYTAVDLFAATGTGDVKPLVGGETGYRIRVRDRRVFCEIIRVDGVLLVTAVVKRGDAY